MNKKPRKISAIDYKAAADCLKVLAHPHRLYMMRLLLDGELTVGELAEACDIRPHVTSEHLKTLARCGLLRGERRGREVYYEVIEKHVKQILDCIHSRFAN